MIQIIVNLVVLILFLTPSLGLAKKYHILTEDIMENRFRIDLPDGDKGTVYLNNDNDFVMIPSIKNAYYVHNCWAKWKFDEKNQLLTIKNANYCEILNGVYELERVNNLLYLRSEEKTVVFKNILGR